MLDDDALADAILYAIDKAVAPLVERIRVLEAREPERGEKGDPGERGADGRNGADGRDGTNGAPGALGEKGDRGDEGPQGIPGRDGRDGAAGRDGERGIDGRDGEKGADGRNGVDGKDGVDGLGFDDLVVEQADDFRTVTLRFARGGVEKTFPLAFPVMLYRGGFRAGETYAIGDVVSFARSSWVARVDGPTDKPDRTSTGWAQLAPGGRDGKDKA